MKNLIFDMGNVLIEWNIEKILNSVTDDMKIKELLKKEIFESGLWVKTDHGLISVEELEEVVISKIGFQYSNSVKMVTRNWYKYVEVFIDVQKRIVELSKKGYDIYILSNTSYTFYELVNNNFLPVVSIAKGIVLSCEEKLLKPDKEIYKVLLERYNLNPLDCIFFDDLEENLLEAISCGVNGFLVEDDKVLLEYLIKL